MSEPELPPLGAVAWVDLTVDDAPKVRDFYAGVVGWTPSGAVMALIQRPPGA